MHVRTLHTWNVTPKEAVALQRELAGQVECRPALRSVNLVAGADCSYQRFSSTFHASVIVLRMPDMEVVETAGTVSEVHFPYVPGLLSFREAPIILETLAKLRSEPDVVFIDGQGLAHPRRFGIACHVGLWIDRPCIGVAKSLLTGTFDELASDAGATSLLVDRGETVGVAVRTKARVKPMFVTVGHRINLASAVRVVLGTCRGYRVPEPTRQAHLHVNVLRRSLLSAR